MKTFSCTNCGASDFWGQNGCKICSYCHSKFTMQIDDSLPTNSTIALDDDVRSLLKKCRSDPKNAYRYANLILDIDPNNSEALTYL